MNLIIPPNYKNIKTKTMQKKLIIFAFLIGTLLAVSPRAVGQHYDDTLHNNLSVVMRASEVEITQVSTNPTIVPLAQMMINKMVAQNMPAEDLAASKAIIEKTIKIAKNAEADSTYHAFFIFMDPAVQQARTYELTLVRNENNIVGILNTKYHVLDADEVKAFHYEIYSSAFGLDFIVSEKSESAVDQDLALYMRQYLTRGAEEYRKTSMNAHGLTAWTLYVTAAAEAVKSLTEAAKGVIAVFKTVKTETLKEHVKGEGFKAYKAMSNYSRILGVKAEEKAYKSFLKAFKIQMGLNLIARIEELDAYFEIAQFASNDWKINDFVFGIGAKDNSCNNLVIINQINYTDNVVHFVSVNVKGAFELADDTLIYTQYKSVFGGISETTKDVR